MAAEKRCPRWQNSVLVELIVLGRKCGLALGVASHPLQQMRKLGCHSGILFAAIATGEPGFRMQVGLNTTFLPECPCLRAVDGNWRPARKDRIGVAQFLFGHVLHLYQWCGRVQVCLTPEI